MMMYDDKYDYDEDDNNLDVLLTVTFLSLSYNNVIPCYLYLFYYLAILATTSINACLLILRMAGNKTTVNLIPSHTPDGKR